MDRVLQTHHHCGRVVFDSEGQGQMAGLYEFMPMEDEKGLSISLLHVFCMYWDGTPSACEEINHLSQESFINCQAWDGLL